MKNSKSCRLHDVNSAHKVDEKRALPHGSQLASDKYKLLHITRKRKAYEAKPLELGPKSIINNQSGNVRRRAYVLGSVPSCV